MNRVARARQAAPDGMPYESLTGQAWRDFVVTMSDFSERRVTVPLTGNPRRMAREARHGAERAGSDD